MKHRTRSNDDSTHSETFYRLGGGLPAIGANMGEEILTGWRFFCRDLITGYVIIDPRGLDDYLGLLRNRFNGM
jgi:hypothetical protein